MSDDRFNLERFVTAQAPVFGAALDELRAGRKKSHWMWFVLGPSSDWGDHAQSDTIGRERCRLEARGWNGRCV